MVRINSAYHPDLVIKKHVAVRSKWIQNVCIMKSCPLNIEKENPKEYHNKMTVLGMVSYVLWVVLVLFSAGFLAWGPRTPIEPFEFDDGFFVTTLNCATVFSLILVFMGTEISFFLLNYTKSPEANENRVVHVLLWIIVPVVLLATVAVAVETVVLLWG